jgi:hypothetical protein
MATIMKSFSDYVSRQEIGMGHAKDSLRLKRWFTFFFVFAWILFLMSGCGVLKPIDNKSAEGGSSQPDKVVGAVYHDFDDILIPKAMQVNRKLSSVFETPTITAGVLSLGGTLKLDELIEFFKTNMTKDNWTAAGMFKGPRSILQFQKGYRWCVITLTDSRYGYKTQVEIWVTPRNDAAVTGLLK